MWPSKSSCHVCVGVGWGRGLMPGRGVQEGHSRIVEGTEGIFQITRDGVD